MKKILITLVIFLSFTSLAMAAKLVCDPQVGVEYYQVTGLPGDNSNVPPDATGTYGFVLDISSLPVGSYTVKARACSGIWCSEESVPFVFARPNLAGPLKVRLIK